MELVPTRATRRMNITTGAMSWRLRKAKGINKEALDPTFTNCSYGNHNSAKNIGYLILKQRVLPTRCVFSLLNTHSKKDRHGAVLFVFWLCLAFLLGEG